MLKVSQEANVNYLAKIICINNLSEINGADKIQTTVIDFQTVVISKEIRKGDYVVYFPVECRINKEFLSFTNTFRYSQLNNDKDKKGFFDENCRVRALRLFKGTVKSCGYVVPLKDVELFSNTSGLETEVGVEFDTINGIKLVEKYEINVKSENNSKQGKAVKEDRLVEGQVHLHVDTPNARKNAHSIEPSDLISVTYKLHGTSFWVSNVIVKRKLSFINKLLSKIGVAVKDTEYDVVYGSRKVIKNKGFVEKESIWHSYEDGGDIWKDIKAEIGHLIPKGFTLYGECVGYDRAGKYIQNGFDYGCKGCEHKLFIYRITNTNKDGVVTELSYKQIEEFCNSVGLVAVTCFYIGYARDMYDIEENEEWGSEFIKQLEKDYTEKDCYMCSNKVPEEGIIIRKEKLFSCEPYKLKSFRFLEYETKELDAGREVLS